MIQFAAVLRSISASFLVLCSISCATTKAITRQDLSAIKSVSVVRYTTPQMPEITAGKQLVGFLLLGGIGAAIAIEASKKDAPLDFGEIVLQLFMDRVTKQIPEWPAMAIMEKPVESKELPPGPTLALRIRLIELSDSLGLRTFSTIEMTRGDGAIIWSKWFQYYSRQADRMRSVDEFKADNNKLLNEEMHYAAERTVDAFIEHLREAL